MSRLIMFLKNNYLYLFLLLLILGLAFYIRWHNLFTYNTYWADDGGAHFDYLRIVVNEHRLPTLAETYVAWHEPIYYFLLALWAGLGVLLGIEFGINNLHWLESLNIFFYGLFLVLVWLFSYFYSHKNKWLALANVFLFSILFVGVKLSAYINNELLNNVFILILVFLFLYWRLLSENNEKRVFFWSIVLAIASLVKITALIIFIAVLITWLLKWILSRKKYFIKYALITFLVLFFINLPWIVYKNHNYNGYFSINIYNDKPHQNILTSPAWNYIFSINTNIFTEHPFWFSEPESYFSVLLSDSFGDYYNLFNVGTENLPAEEKILTGSGRYTTVDLWATMIVVNRLALVIFLIWSFGFGAYLLNVLKNRKIDDYDLFILIVLFGGWAASLYHNLRLPYLEVGVLKAHFIYFSYPIFSLISYRWWWQVIKNKVWWFILIILPLLFYLFISWDVLMADSYLRL